jgi:ABC-2 type transport system permease protein
MAANSGLHRVREWNKLRGFANLFRKESRAWVGTRSWWINALLWTGMLGGLTAVILYLLPQVAEADRDPNVAAAGGPLAFGLEMGRTVFFELGCTAVAIGVIVLSQDLVVEEKQTGVTEWLLAKPVERRAYILAKLSATMAAVLVLLIALPSTAVYGLLSMRAGTLFPPIPFLSGAGIMVVHSLFYLTLTLLLSTLFPSRGPILGIGLGFLLGGNMLAGLLKPLIYVTPWSLAKSAALIAGGNPVPVGMWLSPLVSTLLWSAFFVTMAVISFEKTEL